MKKPDRKGNEGFSLLETVVSTALLLIVVLGFMTMAAANGKLLVKEHRLARSNYELSALAESGEGEPAGESLEVIFSMETGDEITEYFDQYRVSQKEDDQENSLIFYRHR